MNDIQGVLRRHVTLAVRYAVILSNAKDLVPVSVNSGKILRTSCVKDLRSLRDSSPAAQNDTSLKRSQRRSELRGLLRVPYAIARWTFRSLRVGVQPYLLILPILFPAFVSAAESSTALTVNRSGVNLYEQQDDESKIIATLERDEELIPLAQGIGTVSWYMVRTAKGLVGWVKSSDVKTSDQVIELFKESAISGQPSTWSAVTSAGRHFGGTYTVDVDPSSGTVGGTWTLRDGGGKTLMEGSWSANKSPTGWSGAWRAIVLGRSDEYSGTWSTNHRFPPNARFDSLFEAAIHEVVGGEWRAGGNSGSWSIYVGK